MWIYDVEIIQVIIDNANEYYSDYIRTTTRKQTIDVMMDEGNI